MQKLSDVLAESQQQCASHVGRALKHALLERMKQQGAQLNLQVTVATVKSM